MDEERIIKALTDVMAGMHRMEARLERMEARLDSVEVRLDRMEVRLDRMEAGQERTEVRLDRMEAGQERTEARLDRLEAGQDRMRVDLMARMDRLQSGQNQLRDESIVNYETMVRAERSVASAMGGLREEIRFGATQVEALTAEQRTLVRMIRRIDSRVAALEEDRDSPSTGH